MQSQNYEAQKLKLLLDSLEKKQFTGILNLNHRDSLSLKQVHQTSIIIWLNGGIIYGGSKIPNNQEFAIIIGEKFQPGLMETAIQVAAKKLTNPNSVQEIIDWLVKLRIVKWQQIESFVQEKTIWLLESLLPSSGEFIIQESTDFDFGFGEDRHSLNLSYIMAQISDREKKWASFAPIIASCNVTPQIAVKQLETIPNLKIREHLQQWVDGKKTIFEIADSLNKDPLNIAQSYYQWNQEGWVNFGQPLAENTRENIDNRPTIVCIDDSAIIRTMLNRALNNEYQVLLASSAMEGLNMIDNNPVSLVVLDLSMPDMDGLEVCSILRNNPKFKNLPIIMLTARDGFISKFKGRMAGSNKYLTKPFTQEELLASIEELLNT